jgi:hypothetical protein
MLIENENEKRTRGRPKKSGITSATGDYFRGFEDSIILYNSLKDQNEKDKLFKDKMYNPLRVMTQTILRKYFRSRGFPVDLSDEEIIVETMSFIIGILDRFDIDREKKCYSYIQAVIKHHLESIFRGFFKVRFKYESNGETVQRTYYLDEVSSLIDSTADIDNSENEEIIKLIIKETISDIGNSITNMEQYDLNEEDCLVGNAIINILINYEETFDASTTNKFNKSVVLFRISELTLLDPKVIKLSLKKYKEIYKKSKKNLLAKY